MSSIRIEIEFSLWLASKTRCAHLSKIISLPAIPRAGEFIKFRNEQQGDYFALAITQVTYREDGIVEVWTELLDNIDNRMYSFEEEQEFDEYFESYLEEGWECEYGIRPNNRYASRKVTATDNV
ncbi:MAG: hypothetical protein JST84_11210 [Acidobacteria bacterium]|nr:hypothetical protein [Acidobacteriota bacterium]